MGRIRISRKRLMPRYRDVLSEKKIENNLKVTTHAKSFLRRRKLKALFLDGVEGYTERVLYPVVHEMVSVNFDRAVIDAVEARGNALALHGKLSEHLQTLATIDYQPNVIYLDFMSTLLGNKSLGFYPLQDTRDLLMSSKQDKIVLALTFSQRNKITFKRGRIAESAAETDLNIIIKGLLVETQWRVVKHEVVSYSKGEGPMLFMIFDLVRDRSIDPDTHEYYYDIVRKGREKYVIWHGFDHTHYEKI